MLKKWLDVHFYDFIEDMELTNTLISFMDMNLVKNEDLKKTRQALKTAIKKKVFPDPINEAGTIQSY